MSSTKHRLKGGLGLGFDEQQSLPYNDGGLSKFRQNPVSNRESQRRLGGTSGGLLLNQLDHLNSFKNSYNLRLGPLRIVNQQHSRRDQIAHQTLVESQTEMEFKQRTSRQIDFAKKLMRK